MPPVITTETPTQKGLPGTPGLTPLDPLVTRPFLTLYGSIREMSVATEGPARTASGAGGSWSVTAVDTPSPRPVEVTVSATVGVPPGRRGGGSLFSLNPTGSCCVLPNGVLTEVL